MNFQQLRIIQETVRQNFNLTAVANILFTSQPAVSRHIKDLEEQLGIEIFIRKGKRLLGLTDPGKELMGVVEQILLGAQNLRNIANEFSQCETGDFVIGTTHTQARYILPKIIQWFRQDYPDVRLALREGSPKEIADMLLQGQIDIGIATECLEHVPDFFTFPCYTWHHAVIVPQQHPLLSTTPITLKQLGQYPIITYNQGFTGAGHISQAFEKQNVPINIVLSAIDADVIKTYVELGLGVGIIASMAYDAKKDERLQLIDTSHLFPLNTTRLAIRRGTYLRSYIHAFIEKICPDVSEKMQQAMLSE